MNGTLMAISVASAFVGASIASISDFQDIKWPWAPRVVVYENSASIIGIQKTSLTTMLLRNQVEQTVYEKGGDTVPVLYLEQELDFKNRIEKLDRELEGLKK